MYAQVEKPRENKSRSVGNSATQKKSNMKQGFGFVDNRLESKSKKVLQSRNLYIDTQTFKIKENNRVAANFTGEANSTKVLQRQDIIQRVRWIKAVKHLTVAITGLGFSVAALIFATKEDDLSAVKGFAFGGSGVMGIRVAYKQLKKLREDILDAESPNEQATALESVESSLDELDGIMDNDVVSQESTDLEDIDNQNTGDETSEGENKDEKDKKESVVDNQNMGYETSKVENNYDEVREKLKEVKNIREEAKQKK